MLQPPAFIAPSPYPSHPLPHPRGSLRTHFQCGDKVMLMQIQPKILWGTWLFVLFHLGAVMSLSWLILRMCFLSHWDSRKSTACQKINACSQQWTIFFLWSSYRPDCVVNHEVRMVFWFCSSQDLLHYFFREGDWELFLIGFIIEQIPEKDLTSSGLDFTACYYKGCHQSQLLKRN